MTDPHRGDRTTRDSDLRARFAALQKEEAGEAPELALLLRRGGRRGRRGAAGKLVAVAVGLVIVAAALSLLRWTPPKAKRDSGTVVSLVQWRAPTDFLLETPGRDLLRTVPVIGMSKGYARATGTERHPLDSSRGRKQGRKQGLH